MGLQGCLDRQGWDYVINADGGIDVPIPQDVLDRLMVDVEACRAAMGLSSTPAPDTDESLRGFYAMLIDTWQCLRAHGVQMSEPPSEDTFVDDYQRAGEGSDTVSGWHPYDDDGIYAIPADERARVLSECPQPWMP